MKEMTSAPELQEVLIVVLLLLDQKVASPLKMHPGPKAPQTEQGPMEAAAAAAQAAATTISTTATPATSVPSKRENFPT